MFETPSKTPSPSEKILYKKVKKVVAGMTAAGLIMGSAEATIANANEKGTSASETHTITQPAQADGAEILKEQLEQKIGGKIIISESNEKNRNPDTILDNTATLDNTIPKIQSQGKKEEIVHPEKNQLESVKSQLYALSRGLDTAGFMLDESSSYKIGEFDKMSAEFGEQRFCELIKTLEEIFPSETGGKKISRQIFRSYGQALSEIGVKDGREKLNTKLQNMKSLLEEGGIEKLKELFELLRKEGYTKQKYDFSWNRERINQLIDDSEERRALIDFSDKIGIRFEILENEAGLTHEEYMRLNYKDKMKLLEKHLKG